VTEDRAAQDRAIEIIAAFGAAPARWPEAERAGVLALAGHPAVAAALADARRLDALLVDWACADVAAAPFDAARLIPAAASRVPMAPARRRPWLAASALAAALTAVLALTSIGRMAPDVNTPQVAQNSPLSPVPSALASGEAGSDGDFAYIFTPTDDEDALI
jgi:hypothetical protein